jgi:transposase
VIGGLGRARVFAYGAPADMRKSYEGLSGLVREELSRDPLSGDLYLFVNRLRHRAKVLHWDGTGLCVYAKRLEKGRFACLWREAEGGELALSESELRLFLEGCDLIGRVMLSPSPLREKDLYIDPVP